MAKSSASRISQLRGSQKGGDPTQERFRGSSEIPLTPTGVQKAHKTAQELTKLGPFDQIWASSLGRTMRTAQIMATATHSKPPKATPDLQPWRLGRLEGTPVTKEAVDHLNTLSKDAPDKKLPGRGVKSTQDGESFNDFIKRAGGFLYDRLDELKKDPSERVLLVTHYRDLRLAEALAEAGLPKDFKHDVEKLFRSHKGNDDIPPGALMRFWIEGDTLNMGIYDPDDGKRGDPGLYLMRHEETAWNAPTNKQKGSQS